MTESLRILATASREWTAEDVIESAILTAYSRYGNGCAPSNVTLIQGGARGGDAIAKRVADRLGFRSETYHADWDRHGKAAGPIRNQEMVDTRPAVCLGFPIGRSIGTRHCMSRARAAGIPVEDHGPDSTRRELDAMVTESAQLGLYESTAEPRRTR